MNLSDLTYYAKEKFHIWEKHPWSDFPGFSVLNDPKSGKWIALLMRQWDSEKGEEIQRCDLKCGQDALDQYHESYLSQPFRMKGKNWVGVRMGDHTDKQIVFRLLGRAVYGVPDLDHDPAIKKGSEIYKDTKIPERSGKNVNAGIAKGSGNPADPGRKETFGKQSASSIPGSLHAAKSENWNSDIVLEKYHDRPLGEIYGFYQPTEIPAEPAAQKDDRAQKGDRAQENDRYFSTSFNISDFDLGLSSPDVAEMPEKIREMRALYQYKVGRSESFELKCKNFYRQGKFMEDYEDDQPWSGEYRHYFTTYHDLNLPMLRGYFTWRTGIRKGQYQPIATSIAYIYLYELLNEIGTDSPEDALQKMADFEKGFLDAGYGDTGMRANLRRWMLEFAVMHNLPAETARKYADPDLLAWDHSLALLREPENHTDEEIFQALCAAGGKKLTDSPAVGEERGRHLFAAVWKKGLDAFQTEDGRDLFTACFGKKLTFAWYPLANSIHWEEHPHEDENYSLDEVRGYSCQNGKWKEERYIDLYYDRKRISGFLHEADLMFRRYLHTGRYLKEKPEEVWAKPFIQAVIDDDIKEEEEKKRPVITIDLSHLDQIREDAAVTRDSLLTEEELEEPPAQSLLGQEGRNPETGQSVEETEQNLPDNLPEKRMLQTVTEVPDLENGCKDIADSSNISPIEIPSIEGLDATHMEILCKLLRGEPVADYIKGHHLMPSIVMDTINEALFDEIGDNVLECSDDEISIVEDYREDLENLLRQ